LTGPRIIRISIGKEGIMVMRCGGDQVLFGLTYSVLSLKPGGNQLQIIAGVAAGG
jgi:hypothetical protein